MNIRVYPPIVAILYLIVSLILNYFFSGTKIIPSPYNYFGSVIIVASLIFMILAFRTFKKKSTTHDPFGKPTALVTSGPFSISRNPMYLGLFLILIGIAFFIGTIPLFLAPLAFLPTINITFIFNEERKLKHIFDQKYTDYKNSVRRWL
ncbi:MAG: isoprenylcysteine carboxylmethyltransferase family protein [Nanoarchaeota archaeon]|nr:isoprenylcysteine carboxylmethyltransferase family protein [DPANN group archaeon]MBL7116224.1 isoprenylcysteine carboxylmethyltransferase family protein [Nanoarchaeota archaeon]